MYSGSIHCPDCGEPNSPRYDTCGRCGTPLPMNSGRREGGGYRGRANGRFIGAAVLALIVVILFGMAFGGEWFHNKVDEDNVDYTETLEGWENPAGVDEAGDWDDRDDDSAVGEFYMSFANVVLAALVFSIVGFLILLVVPALGCNFGFLNGVGVICMIIVFILMIAGAIWFAFGHTAAAGSDAGDLPNGEPDHDGPWTALYGSETDNDSEWKPGMAWYYFIGGGVFAILSLIVFRGAVIIDRSRAGRPIRPAYRDERYRPRQ